MTDLLRIREAGYIKRYHCKRTLFPQTVAEHSWNVAMLVLHLYPDASKALLKEALLHDVAELYTGDLPAPVKRACEELTNVLDMLEMSARRDMGVLPETLTVVEQNILKFCDTAELVMWCQEELSFGNTGIQLIIRRGIDYLKGYPLDTVRKAFLNELIVKYNNERGPGPCYREYIEQEK